MALQDVLRKNGPQIIGLYETKQIKDYTQARYYVVACNEKQLSQKHPDCLDYYFFKNSQGHTITFNVFETIAPGEGKEDVNKTFVSLRKQGYATAQFAHEGVRRI